MIEIKMRRYKLVRVSRRKNGGEAMLKKTNGCNFSRFSERHKFTDTGTMIHVQENE